MSDFKVKDISFDNLMELSFEHSVPAESYGRRFVIHRGDKDNPGHQESEKVIFDDLVKRVCYLSKKASNNTEREQVKKLISSLIAVESEAKQAYKDRSDCIYKFRSFFHRLFGGAFLGSHTERLQRCEKNIDRKIAFEKATFKLKENFSIFIAFIKNNGSFESSGLKFSYSKDLNKLRIKSAISGDAITVQYKDGNLVVGEKGKLPEKLEEALHQAFAYICETTAAYGGGRHYTFGKIIARDSVISFKKFFIFFKERFFYRFFE